MTEAKIERIIMDRIGAALSAAGCEGVQVLGAWQTGGGGPKGLEEADAAAFVSVKVRPRTYDTPTVPDANVQADVALTVRADSDAGGSGYLAMTEAVEGVLHGWQKDFAAYERDFAVEGEFRPTGFQIDSSDVGLDREACVWQFAQTVSLYGILK